MPTQLQVLNVSMGLPVGANPEETHRNGLIDSMNVYLKRTITTLRNLTKSPTSSCTEPHDDEYLCVTVTKTDVAGTDADTDTAADVYADHETRKRAMRDGDSCDDAKDTADSTKDCDMSWVDLGSGAPQVTETGSASGCSLDLDLEAEAEADAKSALAWPLVMEPPETRQVYASADYVANNSEIENLAAWWSPLPTPGHCALHLVARKGNFVQPLTIAPMAPNDWSALYGARTYQPPVCFLVESAAGIVAIPDHPLGFVKLSNSTVLVPLLMGETHTSGKPLFVGAHPRGKLKFTTPTCAVLAEGLLAIPHSAPFGVAIATLGLDPPGDGAQVRPGFL